jgi:parvulin-like peptidyl-prolyl isomerase
LSRTNRDPGSPIGVDKYCLSHGASGSLVATSAAISNQALALAKFPQFSEYAIVFKALSFMMAAIALWIAPLSVSAEPHYSPDTVVASRGGVSVTMLDVDAALLGVPPRMRANVMNSPKRIDELVDRLLTTRQLAAEGKASKLDDNEIFRQAVKLQEERLLSEQDLSNLRETMDLGDVEELAKERYQVNPGAYAVAGATSARHILIQTKDRSDEEARKLAKEVHDKAIAGEDFVALVKQYSEDPSKSGNDGLVPGADTDAMDPSFAEAVKKLEKPGDISPVVKSQFGYHIIQLVQRTPSQERSFAQVKDKIVKEIDSSMRDVRVKEHIDQLKSMPIDATPEVVASLRTRYLPKGASDEPEIPQDKK